MKPETLRIAICHFHLKTGGVTRVIEHALEALREQGARMVVLAGEAPDTPLPKGVAFRVIKGFAYEEIRDPVSSVDLAAQLRTAARELLGDDPDVWHFHNHSLGKNLAAPEAIRRLAEQGQRLLLQIHDFAEDGRPALYQRMLRQAESPAQLREQLYPLGSQVHYATLNGRDLKVLRSAGIPDEQLHLLPNAIWLPRSVADTSAPLPYDTSRRLWLYPTRAIRRKNLGECLLWSALAPEGDLFATTQAPQNPAEQPVYERWKSVSEELALPMAFELGMQFKGDFLHLLQSAHALISTSITEGFGLAFLEPWLVGRPLAGRDLPEITSDFNSPGVDLSHLYRRLPIPLHWVDAGTLRTRIEAGLKRSLEAYGRESGPNLGVRAWQAFVQDGQVDFGRLDEPLQEAVLRRAATPGGRNEIGLPPLQLNLPAEQILLNQRIIETNFNLARYGERLRSIYHRIAETESTPLDSASADAVLDGFLAPERLFLLKT